MFPKLPHSYPAESQMNTFPIRIFFLRCSVFFEGMVLAEYFSAWRRGPEQCGYLDTPTSPSSSGSSADTGQCFSLAPGCMKSGSEAGQCPFSMTANHRNPHVFRSQISFFWWHECLPPISTQTQVTGADGEDVPEVSPACSPDCALSSISSPTTSWDTLSNTVQLKCHHWDNEYRFLGLPQSEQGRLSGPCQAAGRNFFSRECSDNFPRLEERLASWP